MTKQELFNQYHIDTSHSQWNDNVDTHYSVEIFRIMHEGRLPTPDDTSLMYITDLLDKSNNDIEWFATNVIQKYPNSANWGSVWLTAKRMLYRYSDQILEELNNGESKET